MQYRESASTVFLNIALAILKQNCLHRSDVSSIEGQ
jgi:hypothetical protein